jgi:hypothetical protein
MRATKTDTKENLFPLKTRKERMKSAVVFVHATTLACQPRSTHDYIITFFAPFMTKTSLLAYFFF